MTPQREPAEMIRWPEVSADHLDAILKVAGPSSLRALAVLCSAIGWHLARSVAPSLQARLVGGVGLQIVRAFGLHSDAKGRG